MSTLTKPGVHAFLAEAFGGLAMIAHFDTIVVISFVNSFVIRFGGTDDTGRLGPLLIECIFGDLVSLTVALLQRRVTCFEVGNFLISTLELL